MVPHAQERGSSKAEGSHFHAVSGSKPRDNGRAPQTCGLVPDQRPVIGRAQRHCGEPEVQAGLQRPVEE
eukprot:15287109-Heterocapsa_arctica.AAC.1